MTFFPQMKDLPVNAVMTGIMLLSVLLRGLNFYDLVVVTKCRVAH